MGHQLLRDIEVATKLALGRSSIWAKVKSDPDFPAPIKIGGATLWTEASIDAYIDAKIASHQASPISRACANSIAGKKSAEVRAARKQAKTGGPER